MDQRVEVYAEFARRMRVTNDQAPLNGGIVSHSARLGGPPMQAEAVLEPGLHLSCAIAESTCHSDEFGSFQSRGAILTALFVLETGARFDTHTAGGPIRSFGHYVPIDEIEAGDPLIARIASRIKNQPIVCIAGRALSVVPRLTSELPVDDPMVSSNLLQARGLELAAVVAAHFDQSTRTEHGNLAQRYAHRVRDAIEAHLDQPNLLSDLAFRTGLSVRTITSSFRTTFGESIGDYLLRRRMEVAALAIESGASVHQAAYLVGYTPNAFSRVFKQYYGVNPSSLREHSPD
ncbi:MAG: AraC family transcriptional regulator [Pseudomonadota bacterium]